MHQMPGARPKDYRSGPGHWVVTPIAVSLVIHALLLNALPWLNPLGKRAIPEQLRKTFHITTPQEAVPAILEATIREFGPVITEEPPNDLTSGQPETEHPLGVEPRLAHLDEPLGVAARPPGPLHDVVRPEGVPAASPAETSEPSRRLLADTHTSGRATIKPAYVSRYRSIGPWPDMGLGAGPSVSDEGKALGLVAAHPETAAELLPGGGGGPEPASAVGLPPAGVPAGLEGLNVPPAGLMTEPQPSQLKVVAREPLREVQAKFEMYREPGEPRAYFRLILSLRPDAKMDVIAKDVLFVIDVSRSITGQELEQTRRALRGALGALNRGDRFNMVLFSESTRTLYPDFVAPSPQRAMEADAFLQRRGVEVRTNVYKMIQNVVSRLPKSRRPVSIFLVSDGVSTTGVADARRIVRGFSRAVGDRVSVFTFNAGRPSVPYLLDLLAYRSRGVFVTTADEKGASRVFADLFAHVNRPVLIGLQANYGTLSVAETYPHALPNLCENRPVVIYGRCRPREQFVFRLIGTAARAEKEFFYHRVVPDENSQDATIAREWARGKVHHLVARIAVEGERSEYVQEIRRLGAKYRIPTPYAP